MKPKLLFIASATALVRGSGLAARLEAVSGVLTRHYDVSFAGTADSIGQKIRRRLPAGLHRRLFAQPAEWAGQPRPHSGTFDAVHVFRIYMAPYALPFLGKCPCSLDLDESESNTRARIAAQLRASGGGSTASAEQLEWESGFYRNVEQQWLPRFRRVFVSSRVEAARIAPLCAAEPVLLPNVVPARDRIAPCAIRGTFSLLFVGNLNYYPNRDALSFFLQQVLPLIRRHSGGHPVRLRIAGGGLPVATADADSQQHDVEWLGYVPDLEPLYRDAHAVIAPVRSGGGTRIKIVEAFMHSRPVVATTIAAEGIDARHPEHLLLADTAEDFAAACLRLMREPDLADALAARAYDLAIAHYSPAALERCLDPL